MINKTKAAKMNVILKLLQCKFVRVASNTYVNELSDKVSVRLVFSEETDKVNLVVSDKTYNPHKEIVSTTFDSFTNLGNVQFLCGCRPNEVKELFEDLGV